MFDYFDTKIPWINEIPKSWNIVPLFNVAEENNRKNTEKNDNVLSLSFGKIIRRDLSKNFGLLPNNFDNYQVVDKGYIIIRSTDLQNDKKSLRVGLVKEDGVITSAYIGLSPKSNIHPEYLFYYLNMCDLKKVFYSLGGGLRQSLRYEEFKRFPVIKNDLKEQKLISQYLDKKTSQIDSLIEKIKKKIELLNEQKTSLINQYVTQGLETNVEMKDSGVDFIGEIPKHWEIKKIKHLTQVSVGLVINPSTYFDDQGTIPMITGKHVTIDGLKVDNVDRITKKSNELLEKTRVWENDLVTMRVGYPGRTSIITKEYDGINSASVIITRRSNSLNSKYLSLLANYSSIFDNQVELFKEGTGQKVVNVKSWMEFKLPYPSLKEQENICKYLSMVISQMNKVKNLHFKRKSLLEEYRQSLISSVITGKIRITEDMI